MKKIPPAAKLKSLLEEIILYWNQPRPGEYVPYKEIVMLSIGWLAQYFVVQFSIGFSVGTAFAGATLGMTNNELLVMNYITQFLGYLQAPVNAWLTDNLNSRHGKFRVYIRLAIPLMFLNLISLWFPYEEIRDGVSRYAMIAALFIIGQIQGYVRAWIITGVTNMVHVMTPNAQERAKIMSVTSIIYSNAPTFMNLYLPIMVDVLPIESKYTVTYFRGVHTPLALFAPLILTAFYGTQERLVLPKSRISQMSFTNSLRSVMSNRIFWIKCFDAWNDFLENAKGDVWDMLVYRARITSSSTYGVMNTLCHNSQLWAMLFSPWFIKKFGKKNIKVYKNIIQVALIAATKLLFKSKHAAVYMFIINYINRFIDCGQVIDKAIESDMRDAQHYLVGERIDGSFELISKYANGSVSLLTGLFLPWVYGKCGFDGSDYSVLDVYLDYNPDLPLEQQKKNPDCVLYSMLDVLLLISIFGAAIDVIPWLFYDVSETGQKSMMRVIRLRTLIEDYNSGKEDIRNFIEGCEAVIKAKEYENAEKAADLRKELKKAKRATANNQAEKISRKERIKELKRLMNEASVHNEEIEISKAVMFEINRFSTDFGKSQLALAELIVNAGSECFYDVYDEAVELAYTLPLTGTKEEKVWRRQEIRNAKALKKSAKLAQKYYPDGKVFFDEKTVEDAYNLPDETREQQKIRRKAMKKANKAQNLYIRVAAPYLSAQRTVLLAEGYENLPEIISGYDEAVADFKSECERRDEQARLLKEEQRLDIERKRAQCRLKKR
ncbi:MAG: hypothetical protein E7543_07435 [Ruminococcaceae bacterium]|nr:hypothetical protein [Oscillospiraceae bacterium]